MSLFSLNGHLLAVRELRSLLTRHRELTLEMTRREITDRYAGQVFGTLWTICHPVVMMLVYIFAFAVIFKIDTGNAGPLDYTAYLLAGLIPWMAFAEVLAKSGTVVTGHSNLVKQVVFPVEVLPIKAVLSACVTELIMFALLCIYVLATNKGCLLWTYALLPVLFLVQVLGMIGICFIFSSIGTFFRDLPNFLQVVSLVCFYLMPILYLPTMIKPFAVLFYFNPFSYMIWCFQDVLFYGSIKHPWAFAVFIPGCLALFYGGYRLFRGLKSMFGNVL